MGLGRPGPPTSIPPVSTMPSYKQPPFPQAPPGQPVTSLGDQIPVGPQGSSGDMPFMGQMANFDSPMWQGPYGAPLTTMQLDSMGAMQRMLQSNPLAQTMDIQQAISQAVGGMPSFGTTDINQFLSQGQNLYGNIPGMAGAGTGLIQGSVGLSPGSEAIFNQTIPAFGEMLAGPSFNNTEMFRAGEQAFQGDLDQALARAKEEFSGLGLGPGSTDRAQGLARTAATESARFRLGQQEQAAGSFENAQQRRLAAAGLAPSLSAAFESPQERALRAGGMLSQIGLETGGLQAQMLPMLSGMAQVPFQERLQSQQVGAQSIPNLLQAFNNPAMLSQMGFNMGTAGQQTADQQITRMMQEFARTQNANLPFMLGMLGQSPQQQMNFGPSLLSQLGQLGLAGAQIYGATRR